MLRGGLPRVEREQLLAEIEKGEIDLVVGTQALIEKDIAFRELALVVVDEQHKFGVVQRAEFRTKGPMPHYLVMTATPIPRTLAMTVFGDLDVSTLRHAPPGRGRIVTRVVADRQWTTVMEYVRGRLEKGEQAFVVCPRIGEAAKDEAALFDADEADGAAPATVAAGDGGRELLSVRRTFEELTRGPWSGLRVGLLHGGQAAADKRATVGAFSAGRLQAIVSTTVVEVGVDVPNATIMIVEHAERFGLSQLHQLRGRVGRGARDSLCVLIARGPALGQETKAAERLKVMTQSTDGFRIAEADLKQRGPGELLGTRQHGLPELRIGSLVDDFALLEQARADAFEIVQADPELKRPEHRALWPALRRLFGGKLALIDAA
jgi:ATP-dependent DNA helicase RecG